MLEDGLAGIFSMATSPDMRRRGVASALLASLLTWAWEHGASHAYLQVDSQNHPALAAYRVGSVDFMTLLDDRMIVNKYRQELYVLEADQGKAWADLEMLTDRALIDSNSTK